MFACIDRFLGHSCTLNEWRFLLGSNYDTLRPLLLLTGRKATDWCCPFNGRKQPVASDESGASTVSSSCTCTPCVEARRIAPEDLDCWKFSSTALAQHLGRQLGLSVAPRKLNKGALRLGFLTHKKTRLPAFLLQDRESSYQAFAQSLDLSQYEGCLFYTPRYCSDTADWFGRNQLGYFSLEDLLLPGSLSPSPIYWQLLHEFKSTLAPDRSRKEPKIFIAPDYKRITFPDGYVLNLARAHKRRAVVRFIHEQLARSGKDEFDIEIMREEYNRQHPEHPWDSDRIREDLFKRNPADFDRLFETLDAANGRYRLKI